jgi:hypothetical protein
MINPRLNVVLWLVNYDELVFGHLSWSGRCEPLVLTPLGEVAVNPEFRLGSSSLSGLLSLETAWALGSAWSILPSLRLSLETASCCCLESVSLNCSSPLVCRTSCLPFGAEEACRLSWSLGCDPIWEITGRGNDLFTYWFCKDKSTRLIPL